MYLFLASFLTLFIIECITHTSITQTSRAFYFTKEILMKKTTLVLFAFLSLLANGSIYTYGKQEQKSFEQSTCMICSQLTTFTTGTQDRAKSNNQYKCCQCHAYSKDTADHCLLRRAENLYYFHYECFAEFRKAVETCASVCQTCADAVNKTSESLPHEYQGSQILKTPRSAPAYEQDDNFDDEYVEIGRCWACALTCCPLLLCFFRGQGCNLCNCPEAYSQACHIACCGTLPPE